MGYAGKLELQYKARRLRKRGMSIKAIEKKLGVSRSSVSLWVRDIKLTKRQIKRLYLNRKTGAMKGSYIAAENKMKNRKILIESLKKEGKKEIKQLSKRDRFVAGVAMYFAEGSKRDGSVQFCNSDPMAIKFMVSWIREFLNPPKSKFRGALYIHDNLEEQKAKNFWAHTTNIPLDQFTKTYKVKNNPKRFRKVKHPYGIFRVTIHDVNFHRRLMGWISGLLENQNIPR